jgi:hypothetical protein
VNVSNGTPLYAGVVQYPQAIVSNPAASGTQSINGALNLNGFNLSGVGAYTSSGSGSLKITTPGDFSAGGLANYQNYGAVNVNNLNPQSEQASIGRGAGNVQDALYGAINVPATDTTVTQLDAVAGYISNASPSADPVAIYGQARANYNTTGQNQSWAANLLCSDTLGMTQNGSCYGLEIDVNLFSNKLNGWALDLNGNFNENGGSGNTYGGILLVKPGPAGSAKYWSPGLEFGPGATPAPSATGPTGAVVFLPQSTGNSQNSQGFLMQATGSGGNSLNQWVYVSNFGDMLWTSDSSNALTFAVGYSGLMSYNRPFAQLGSAVVAGDFALSAGWGSTASIASVRGEDALAQVTVTANGSGIAVNPSITFTYHDGSFINGIALVSRCDANSPQIGNVWVATAFNSTSVQIFFLGTPVAGNTYCANIQSIRAKN